MNIYFITINAFCGLDMKKYSAIKKFQILEQNIHDGVPMSRIAADQQLSLRTLHHWNRQFLLVGISGLETTVRRIRASQGS